MYVTTRYGLRALMMTLCLWCAAIAPGPAHAQVQGDDRVFVQIESAGSLNVAQQRVRDYTQRLENVNGFQAGNGLYAIALGPFTRADAQVVLNNLLATGQIPGDSYIEGPGLYASQFFPVGRNALITPPVDLATPAPAPVQVQAEEPVVVPVEDPEPAEPVVEIIPEETPQQARQSEAQLDGEARRQLQIALEWFGFYRSGIDGAFGPGTRASMQAWQIDRGFEGTSILTTSQRAQLLDEYRGELAALGMQRVIDTRAGIEIDLPTAMVSFSEYNFPFAQYAPVDDSGVQVLLISQPGNQTTLFGLYEIMQTLTIIPLEGERRRERNGFLLTGQSETSRAYAEARIVGNAIKGFVLVWPPERDAQMDRVLPLMQQSFTPTAGALDPGAVPEGLDASLDLVSGLDVRRPERVRSGFFVDAGGSVITTTEVLGQCDEILIDNSHPAEVSFRDDALGLAVLSPEEALAPLAFATLSPAPARLTSQIAVAGFPFEGALSAASMSFGTLDDLRGINGEETLQRLRVNTSESEAGGPVLDMTGTVIGMVLPGIVGDRALPAEVSLALRSDLLQDVLAGAGLSPRFGNRATDMNRENLAVLGADMTVTVSCWN